MLKPTFGRVLVRLGGKFKHVSTEVKTYEAASSGKLIEGEVRNEKGDPLPPGTLVYWSDLIAGNPIQSGGYNYRFIEIDRIEGYEVAEQSN